jgi:hypothetical protein
MADNQNSNPDNTANNNNQSGLGGFPSNNTPKTPDEVENRPSKPEIGKEIRRSDLPEKS